jgi:hypothetical protein
MAKSKIIKDLVSDKISLTQALDRLIIISMELEDAELSKWAKREKSGYETAEDVPSYRITKLHPMGSYQMVGYGNVFSYANKPLPTLGISDSMRDSISNHHLMESIPNIEDRIKEIDKGNKVGIPVPPELYHMFEEGTTLTVTGAMLMIDKSSYVSVIEGTKTRLIEILILLEKNFGTLDDFDVDIRDYDTDEIQKLKEEVAKIVAGNSTGNTYFISKSKIKGSNIGESNSVNKTKNLEVSPSLTVNNNSDKKGNLFVRLFKFLFRRGL